MIRSTLALALLSGSALAVPLEQRQNAIVVDVDPGTPIEPTATSEYFETTTSEYFETTPTEFVPVPTIPPFKRAALDNSFSDFLDDLNDIIDAAIDGSYATETATTEVLTYTDATGTVTTAISTATGLADEFEPFDGVNKKAKRQLGDVTNLVGTISGVTGKHKRQLEAVTGLFSALLGAAGGLGGGAAPQPPVVPVITETATTVDATTTATSEAATFTSAPTDIITDPLFPEELEGNESRKRDTAATRAKIETVAAKLKKASEELPPSQSNVISVNAMEAYCAN
ncbi:hypothetical protein ACLX1H_004543 [Fusarium chlamydosporum]